MSPYLPLQDLLASWLNSSWQFHPDVLHIFNSPLDSSSSGVGGWGDPTNDYQVYAGGFKDQIWVYPTPHHTRNFSPFPFSNPEIISSFTDGPAPPPLPVGFNTTIIKQKVDHLVNN